MMIKSKNLGIWAALLCLIAACSTSADEHIRICSFNIAEFGEGSHPQTRQLDFIAQMLVDNNVDLIAIEEVGTKDSGAEQVANLRTKMNQHRQEGTPQYFYFVTPMSGDERCAVIYRHPVIKGDDVYWLDDDKSPGNPRAGGETYYRIPVALAFRAGDMDFVVVIVHLTWTDTDRRKDEFAALRAFLRKEDVEADWIILGDTNRYGLYGATSPDKPFDQLLTDNWKTYYRFPLLEAVTEPDDMKVFQASEDAQSTTVAPSKDLYDQIIITDGAYREFGSDSPVLGQHVGIIPFDMDAPYSSITDHNEVKFKVSDHRPIWIRLRIDGGDDD
jgi:endonuclease/exonuclease/phosphatase family metal-dependent hydrolase